MGTGTTVHSSTVEGQHHFTFNASISLFTGLIGKKGKRKEKKRKEKKKKDEISSDKPTQGTSICILYRSGVPDFQGNGYYSNYVATVRNSWFETVIGDVIRRTDRTVQGLVH